MDAVKRGKAALLVVILLSLPALGESPGLAWSARLPGDLTERQVYQLIEQLGDLNFEVREQASSRLYEIGPVVLQPVYEATRGNDPEVCVRCWRLIDAWAGEGDVSALLTQLRSRSPSIRATAAETLAKVEPRPLTAIPGLIEATDDNVEFVRVSAREALKKIQDPRGLRVEFQELSEKVEMGTQVVYRIDVTNCGKETVNDIRLLARVPAQLQVVAAQGGNRPLNHQAKAGKLTTETFHLEPNATLRWEVTATARGVGEARFKIELTADGLTYPLIEEKSTTIHLPMAANDPPMNQ